MASSGLNSVSNSTDMSSRVQVLDEHHYIVCYVKVNVKESTPVSVKDTILLVNSLDSYIPQNENCVSKIQFY
jgi:hypothetical protein